MRIVRLFSLFRAKKQGWGAGNFWAASALAHVFLFEAAPAPGFFFKAAPALSPRGKKHRAPALAPQPCDSLNNSF